MKDIVLCKTKFSELTLNRNVCQSVRRISIQIIEVKGLKGHCHDDFAVFWSKLLEYLTKNLACNMTLLLQHREENIKRFFS